MPDDVDTCGRHGGDALLCFHGHGRGCKCPPCAVYGCWGQAPEDRLRQSFANLAADAVRDVELARAEHGDPGAAAIAWDRAAGSLRVLMYYCEQRRDECTLAVEQIRAGERGA